MYFELKIIRSWLFIIMDKAYASAGEDWDMSDLFLERLDSTPLLVDYFATCGIRQKDLLDYIVRLEEAKTPVLPSLQSEVLAKNKLVPEVTSRYPPVDKPSFPFPPALQNFCFPMGYEVREGDENFAVSSSFILTNGTGKYTYVAYCFLITLVFLSYTRDLRSC